MNHISIDDRMGLFLIPVLSEFPSVLAFVQVMIICP